jgi:tetrapyrrole methylase family protein/MazG family protein
MKKQITVVGLGSGDENRLSLGVFRKLVSGIPVYLRTAEHPVVSFLQGEGVNLISFDHMYQATTEFTEVYQNIVNELISEVTKVKELIYAVPGHPLVAEQTVRMLYAAAAEKGIAVHVLGGESFIDTFFERMLIDPIDGFTVLNGKRLRAGELHSNINTLVAQVYNQLIASHVKLALMEYYPDDYVVYIVENLGIPELERVTGLPIFELDRESGRFHNLSSVLVPRNQEPLLIKRDLNQLLELIRILRGPDGCPWDRVQTHQSIRKNLIEETYELVEAIDHQDFDEMLEELGDVFLQVILHSLLAEDKGYFDFHDVIEELMRKLIRRHPHVFGDAVAGQEEEARAEWERIKAQENVEGGMQRTSVLDGVPLDLPETYKAYKLQKKAAGVGFDWSEVESVYDKIKEELTEVSQATGGQLTNEIGDLLFAVVNLARFYKVDPEEALAATNRKFVQRFKHIEEVLNERGIPLAEAGLELMDVLWEEAKQAE